MVLPLPTPTTRVSAVTWLSTAARAALALAASTSCDMAEVQWRTAVRASSISLDSPAACQLGR